MLQRRYCGVEVGIGNKLNTRCALIVVKQHANDLGLDQYVQIGVLAVLKKRMEITVSRVLAPAVRG